MNRRTKLSPRNQSPRRATEIENEIETRLREAFRKNRELRRGVEGERESHANRPE